MRYEANIGFRGKLEVGLTLVAFMLLHPSPNLIDPAPEAVSDGLNDRRFFVTVPALTGFEGHSASGSTLANEPSPDHPERVAAGLCPSREGKVTAWLDVNR